MIGPDRKLATDAATIDAMRKRYELLNKKRIEADANLANAAEMLENLRREAREKFGTDDLPALQKMLADMKGENDRKLTDYRRHLEQIETRLAEVEAAQEGGRRAS
jgi:hypothetical protein